MKPYTHKASAIWQGGHRRGGGVITTPSAVLQREAYTFGRAVARSGTSPPELIAAAHAGSFSMTLANELGEAGYRPRQIDTTATVTMEDIAAGWTMTQIHLDVVATVPKVAQCDFVDAALRAKANCPISRSLNANISMRAKLSQRGATVRLLPRRNWSPAGLGIFPKKGPRRNGAKN
jgi:osmotically inducible protein OsmC